jgi:glycine/D-amino acid oxidase-like deaminating enzyme
MAAPSAHPDRVSASATSWWLREALARDPGAPVPALEGEESADVVILGGGYTGLWTAYELSERDPAIRTAILEADVCGGGASGRNGGFVTSWWDEIASLRQMYGAQSALAACRELDESIRGIRSFSERHGEDVWFTPAGCLQVATSPAQVGAWRASVEACAALGVREEYVELSAEEVRARCASPVFLGAGFMRVGATVHPARLARALRRALLERGVVIHEHSPVRRLETGRRGGPGRRVRAMSLRGAVGAERAVVALNAWGARWPGLRRRLVVWGSHIVLTAPAPDEVAALGWNGECISDSRSALHYVRTTPDGRVAFGGGGGRASWLGRTGARLDRDPESVARAAAGLRRLFPSLAHVPIEDAWGGPIDISPNHLPFFGTLRPGNVHYGAGYSGNGVAPSHLGGRVLAALVLDRPDATTELPIVNRWPRAFPPEPLRSIGTRVVREAIVRRDQAEDAGRRVGRIAGIVSRLPRKLGYHLGPE